MKKYRVRVYKGKSGYDADILVTEKYFAGESEEDVREECSYLIPAKYGIDIIEVWE